MELVSEAFLARFTGPCGYTGEEECTKRGMTAFPPSRWCAWCLVQAVQRQYAILVSRVAGQQNALEQVLTDINSPHPRGLAAEMAACEVMVRKALAGEYPVR